MISSIAASDLYVQSIFSDWNFNDIWYMTSGSYPMLQVTNKASSVSAQSIDLFADGETTCEHIVYIRDTKNSANIYIKAQNLIQQSQSEAVHIQVYLKVL